MQTTSGQSRDGLMTLIPLSVLLFIVIVALGGPESFVNTVASFATDASAYAARWIRSF
jgi:hypothetical protein